MPRVAHLTAAVVVPALIGVLAAGCGGGGSSAPTTSAAASSAKTTQAATKTTAATTPKTTTAAGGAGLTSIEASNLAWPRATGNFGDAVLWRMAPVPAKDSTAMALDPNWTVNDRAPAWFIWYADADGEDWLLISVQGKSIAKIDIGTRSFSKLAADAAWPRQAVKVSMKDAAAAAAKQGAHLDNLTWVEFSMDYALSDMRRQPLWVFACVEHLPGGTLDYRIFVNAITGAVAGCYNERNEKLALPLDRAALTQTHAASHEADVRQFFSFIEKGDVQAAVNQMAYQAAPNEAMRLAWGNNFKSLKSLKVVSVEQADLASWTSVWERYKVVLEVTTAETPDKYGWENGRNTRWVTIIPQGAGGWKVAELSPNP
jgi:hypothetical protein